MSKKMVYFFVSFVGCAVRLCAMDELTQRVSALEREQKALSKRVDLQDQNALMQRVKESTVHSDEALLKKQLAEHKKQIDGLQIAVIVLTGFIIVDQCVIL